MKSSTYGQAIHGLSVDGRSLSASVFNEHQVRAAAGLTLAIGAVAYAFFVQMYLPIRIVAMLFFIEFALRVTLGVHRSPLGMLAGLLVRRQPPMWVSAKPKRFAWTLGLAMTFSMIFIGIADVRGALPLTICVVCLVLMWLETALGLCLGCEIHGVLVRRGWVRRDTAYEVCAGDACAVPMSSTLVQSRHASGAAPSLEGVVKREAGAFESRGHAPTNSTRPALPPQR